MPFIDSGGRAIWAQRQGQGPAVLFLHGAGSNAATWWQQLPAFSARHTCVTLDQRCFGRSAAPMDGASPRIPRAMARARGSATPGSRVSARSRAGRGEGSALSAGPCLQLHFIARSHPHRAGARSPPTGLCLQRHRIARSLPGRGDDGSLSAVLCLQVRLIARSRPSR